MRLSIKDPVTAALAIGAAALVLAACGGDSGASGSSGLVSVRSVDGTNVLADSKGRTLYNAEVEKGRIRCTGARTSFWEPILRVRSGIVPDDRAALSADTRGLPTQPGGSP